MSQLIASLRYDIGHARCDGDARWYLPALEPTTPTPDSASILEHLMEVDDEHLYVFVPFNPESVGWVYFVYGNDGYDVISDYTTGLEAILAPVITHADTLS